MSFTTTLTTAMALQTTTRTLRTSQPLTAEQRDYLVDLVATRYLDCMDGRDLERFFFDVQSEYLKEYTDEELLGAVEDIANEDEYEEVLNEID
jgi:hypothetical protein